ncbi:MAG: LptF/LptG family permease, partial [Myxococcota bacterium]
MNKFIPRTLFGYIFQRAAISFFLFLMIISTILLLVSFIQYADIFLIANISSGDILKIILLMFPLSFEFAIPLSVVASLMYVFYVMEVKNEVLAIELTGF